MKLSDFIMQFLVEKDIRTIFLVSGGGIMHLVDSVGKIRICGIIAIIMNKLAPIAQRYTAGYPARWSLPGDNRPGRHQRPLGGD